jgi:hypothetical protein
VERRKKQINQQICGELEAIPEVEENPNISSNEFFAANSSRTEPL